MKILVEAFKGLKIWQAGVLVAVLVGMAGATYGAYAMTSNSNRTGLTENQQLVPVQYGDIVNQVSINGSVSFTERASLTFESQGTVSEVLVREGDTVEAGQPLAKLDAASVVSLERALAQARANLRTAEENLEKAKAVNGPKELAQIQVNAANARLAVSKAEEALNRARTPFGVAEVAQAEAAVANARLALRNAQEALDGVSPGGGPGDIEEAQSQLDSALLGLAIAERDLRLAQRDGDAKTRAASDKTDEARAAYKAVIDRWLGAVISDEEGELEPSALMSALGVDLHALFDPDLRLYDSRQAMFAAGPPPEDPETRWSELIVYAWMNFYPGIIAIACDDLSPGDYDLCITKEMEDAWQAYGDAREDMETVELQAAKAVATVDAAVSKARDTLRAAEETLARLLDPDLLDIEIKEKQLAMAQANLAKAEEELARVKGGPDPLEVEARRGDLAVARASLAEAEEELARAKSGADPIQVALRQAELDAARLELETAQRRLDKAILKAPMSGVVAAVMVSAGDAVNASTQVVEVIDPSVVEVAGMVDEIDVLLISPGARVAVSMDALPGRVLQGTVSSVASAARNQQGVVSYPIRIRLQVPEGIQLREGLTALASVVLTEERGVLRVPITALRGTFNEPTVRVVTTGRMEERPVRLGTDDGFWVAVREGLSQGEQVVMDVQRAGTGAGFIGGFRQAAGAFTVTGGGPGPSIQVIQGAPGGGRGGR